MSTAWTPGTNGLVSGEAVYAVIETPEDMAKFKGQLKGKFVLTTAMREVPALWTAPATRYTEQQLDELERETDAAPRGGRGAVAPAVPGVRAARRRRARRRPELRSAAAPSSSRTKGSSR